MHVDAFGISPGRRRRAALLRRLAAHMTNARDAAAAVLLRGYLNYHRPLADPEEPFMTDLDELDALLRAGRFREALARIDVLAAEAAVDDEADEVDHTPALRGDPERHVALAGPRRRVVGRGLSARDAAAHARGERTLGVLPGDLAGARPRGRAGRGPAARRPRGPGRGGDHRPRALRCGAHPRPRDGDRGFGGKGFHVWVPYRRPSRAVKGGQYRRRARGRTDARPTHPN